MSSKVWFITGTSSGFGNELVKYCLAQGTRVVATSRDASKLSFEGATKDNFLGLSMDLTSRDSIEKAFDDALKQFGQVDYVVNNAGYGLCGPFEALKDEHIRMQWEINFHGLVAVTRKALEVMRDSGNGGLIQQVTSIGGQTGVPTFSMYCATKWAVEGFTEALSQEVKPEWKIKLQLVEPGGFRTEWAGAGMIFADPHPAYDHINAKEIMAKRNGTQVGDPVKGARAMYELATMDDPPLRCVIGSDAYKRIMDKISIYEKNYKKYEKLSNSTDVEE